jgi:pyrroloquinoline-quinone synthase
MTSLNTRAKSQTIDLDTIDALVQGWSIDRSAAMQRFARGEGRGREVAETLAREFYSFCIDFPLFLAAAISHVRDEQARMFLVANLYEEHGELDASRIHPELFRNFVRAIGLDPNDLSVTVPGSIGAEAAAHVMDICRQGPAHRALAALYAIELLFGPICDLLARGLEQLAYGEQATHFFVLHSGADVVHSEQLRSALARSCRSEADLFDAAAIAVDVACMFYRMFDAIASNQTSAACPSLRRPFSSLQAANA